MMDVIRIGSLFEIVTWGVRFFPLLAATRFVLSGFR
jgi:hypothetical protein